MKWLIHSMAGGEAFVVCGVALLISLPVAVLSKRWWAVLPAALVAAVSAIVIGLCSIPLPILGYASWMALVAVTVVMMLLPRIRRPWGIAVLVLAELAGVIAIASESPWWFWSGIPPINAARLYVVGDSLSAGVGTENGQTWPRLLGKQHPVEVIDMSVAAATTSSIMDRIDGVNFGKGLVVLEIGGNDVFTHKDPATFAQDLERLVRKVSGAGRVLVMFELPLYPLNGEYGRVQRRVALAEGIKLIPRHILARIITTPGNTIEDGLHLSVPGQQYMADVVWGLIGSSLPAPSADRAGAGG